MIEIIPFIEIALVVGIILRFFQTPTGKKIGQFLPTPFWVYFLSILLGTLNLIPSRSPAYGFIGLHLLPAALVLMLIGTPINLVMKLGKKALAAMVLGTVGMLLGTVVSFLLFAQWMPPEPWKIAGTMLGTWTGGSANMLAVKEIVGMSDGALGPLIVTDTFLSYGWMALLMMGVALQRWFDTNSSLEQKNSLTQDPGLTKKEKGNSGLDWKNIGWVLAAGLVLGEATIGLGYLMNQWLTFFSLKAWAILIASTVAVILASTSLSSLEEKGASAVGTYLLYMVLASMGVKTDLTAALEAPIVMAYGAVVLGIHGAILLTLGRMIKIPLFLLATGSQANVGGPVSAPIVAGVYKPGFAHLGVLMAIFGGIIGSYVGFLGGYLCRWLEKWVL